MNLNEVDNFSEPDEVNVSNKEEFKNDKISVINIGSQYKDNINNKDILVPYYYGNMEELKINNKFKSWCNRYNENLKKSYDYLDKLCILRGIHIKNTNNKNKYRTKTYINFLRMMFLNSSDNNLTKDELKMVENEIDL